MHDRKMLFTQLQKPENMGEHSLLQAYADAQEDPDADYTKAVSGLLPQSPESAAIYRQLIADNKRDVPLRLGYAAWLSASGNESHRERGEFTVLQQQIAAQLEESLRPRQGDHALSGSYRRDALLKTNVTLRERMARADKLLQKNFLNWLADDFGSGIFQAAPTGEPPLDTMVMRYEAGPSHKHLLSYTASGNAYVANFEGGQPDNINLHADNALAVVPRLFSQPHAARLSIRDIHDESIAQLEALLKLPEMQNVRYLSLEMHALDAQRKTQLARMIAQSPHLSELQGLRIQAVNDNVVYELSQARNLSSLESLKLKGDITVASLEHLAKSPRLPKLESLSLKNINDGSVITRAAFAQLGNAHNLAGLTLQPDSSLAAAGAAQHIR